MSQRLRLGAGLTDRRWRYGGLLAALAIACGPGDTAIALHVSQIPLLANELRVQVDVDGQLSGTVGSYAPPPAMQSELRVGVRLIKKASGQAALSVAACNGACLLAQNSLRVDLAQGDAEPGLPLVAERERLDLNRCAARAPILCNLQLERSDRGSVTFALEGAGLEGGSGLSVDGQAVPSARVVSPSRIESSQLPKLSRDDNLVEVATSAQSSVLRRLNIAGLPLGPTPITVEQSQPSPQLDRIPIVTNVHVADLDLDGHQDVAVAGTYYLNTSGAVPANPGFVSIYYGDGQRGFVRRNLPTALAGFPRSLTSGQLRGSGLPQLIVSTADLSTFLGVSYAFEFPPSGAVVILEQTAPRTYAAPIEIKIPTYSPHQALVMDIDRDGQNDLLVGLSNVRTLVFSFVGSLGYWKGGGAGWQLNTLTSGMLSPIINDLAAVVPLSFEPWDGATGNQPGGLAVAVERKSGINFQGELWLVRSNGAGGFTSSTPLTTPGLALQLMAGDFSGDGRRDLLLTLPVANDRKTALRRVALFTDPEGGAAASSFDLALSLGTASAIDLFGDRRDDLVLYQADSTAGQLSMLPTQSIAPHLGEPPYAMAVSGRGQALLASGDLDHDGHADLVVVTTGTLDNVSPYTSQFDVHYGR
ncbi:MAG TPA: VCBS repeat-containing protein [Pseudomonadota bacterium]|nr:VCBS repeat-containing protein [Pseudomonadota bacterium]